MVDDNYFDACLLMGDSNIAIQMHQDEFLKLNFEDKVGLLVAKMTNEALEDNNIKFLESFVIYLLVFHYFIIGLVF